jgi:hypothetical protein
MEISSSDFKILKSINFADQNILVKNCSYSEENQCIYFFGYYGNTFPNLIGSFDLNSLSFTWTFILENKNSGNTFYKCPQNVGDYIAAIDGQNNLLIFEKDSFNYKANGLALNCFYLVLNFCVLACIFKSYYLPVLHDLFIVIINISYISDSFIIIC